MIPRVRPNQRPSAKRENQIADMLNKLYTKFAAGQTFNPTNANFVYGINLTGRDIELGECVPIEPLTVNPRPDYPIDQAAQVSINLEDPTSQTWTNFVIAMQEIKDGRSGPCAVNGIVLAKVVDSGTATDEYCDLSSGADWYYLQRSESGPARIVWIADEDSPYEDYRLALVQFPIGGGGGSIEIVQAQSNGSAGVVSVKSLELKGDVTASPNFQVSGSAFNVNYFKL